MVTRLLLCLLALTTVLCSRVEVARRDVLPKGWTIDHKTRTSLHVVEFTVFVKQQNLFALKEKFDAVSDPDSPEYGQFLTPEEANTLIAPKPEHMLAVGNWLRQYRRAKVSQYSDHFTVRTNVMTAERILDAKFKMHHHVKGETLLRVHGKMSVPSEVHDYIHFIAGATELITSTTSGHITARRVEATATPIKITPSVLRKYYNIPEDLKSQSPRTINGIAAFNDRYNPSALDKFREVYQLDNFTVTNYGPTDNSVADFIESDLDVQYISAVAEGTDLYFVQEPNGYWILQFLVDAQKSIKGARPTVYSISYGWFELNQCLWASVNCPKLGYTGEVYVNRTDTLFQLFGLTGVSVFVADGDDGSAGYNCPIDGNVKFCPNGKCAYTETACPAVSLYYNGAQCNFPALGQREQQPGCDAVSFGLSPAIDALFKANPQCNLRMNGPLSSTCACEDIKPVTVNGVTAKGFTFNASLDHVFAPIWPGSSPFVTSVGASYFNTSDGQTVSSEIVSSTILGAVFTTGGGFSYFQNQENYQSSAVKEWIKRAGDRAPPSWAYSPQYRGFPDIIFNGNNYDVYFSNTSHGSVGGTSASSPASAGLFNLINDALLSKGKTPLGFLNPLLYKMAKAQPSTFNDITSGDNKCDGYLCCKYGYVAEEGWDPVSGLGSPNFGEILKFVLKLKGL